MVKLHVNSLLAKAHALNNLYQLNLVSCFFFQGNIFFFFCRKPALMGIRKGISGLVCSRMCDTLMTWGHDLIWEMSSFDESLGLVCPRETAAGFRLSSKCQILMNVSYGVCTEDEAYKGKGSLSLTL